MRILPSVFYRRADVTQIARELLGKVLVTQMNGGRCSARIVETEAYAGVVDKASHAYGGRFTDRTRVMYEDGGVAYVYLCYGIHHLFNVVTHVKGVPHAVLVRAAEPLEGLSLMSYRSGRPNGDSRVCSGPGKLARAMGITGEFNGRSLLHARFHIADDGLRFSDDIIRSTPRIGVDYAGDDALLRYRFIVGGSPFLSGSRAFNEVR